MDVCWNLDSHSRTYRFDEYPEREVEKGGKKRIKKQANKKEERKKMKAR
jgi:hypothetical protein